MKRRGPILNARAKRVLLGGGEVHILRAAEIPLRYSGFEVVCASDGLAAWDEIQRQTPDVLITDWQMPRLDGLGLIARCRDYPPTRELPILMLTGRSIDPERRDLAR